MRANKKQANISYTTETPKHKNLAYSAKKDRNCTSPISTLAEDNLVRYYSKITTQSENINQQMPTNSPQRIELPLFFNTPVRRRNQENKILTKKNRILPIQLSPIKNDMPIKNRDHISLSFMVNNNNKQIPQMQKDQQEQFINETKNINNFKISIENIYNKEIDCFAHTIRRIKDYQFLAFACKRAGKTRDEGRSYYSIGVLFDNIGKFKNAISYYKKFLNICKSINDSHGQSLANNCLGVDYQLMTQEDNKYLDDAIKYHKQHLELADQNGKFLANINLGLCYDQKGEQQLSLHHYQQALQQALRINTNIGQSVVIGNIGKVGFKGLLLNNEERVRTFISKYISLAKQMNNVFGELQGQVKLAELSSKMKNNNSNEIFDEGKQRFLKAMELAEEVGDNSLAIQAKCGFAIANAENSMDEFLEQVKMVLAKQE